MEFGANVRRRRKELGMTQSELAIRIDRSIHLVGRLERGKKWPALKTAIEVAIALQIDVRSLFPEKRAGAVDRLRHPSAQRIADCQNASSRSARPTISRARVTPKYRPS